MTADRDRRGRGRALGRWAAGVAALVIVLSGGFVRPSSAAQPNQLLNPRVVPTAGTTKTTIAFSVRYESSLGNAPTSVTATVGNIVVPLSKVSGTRANGRYRGTTKLPAGTWSVLFQASAQGNDPSLDGPNVRITRAPTPTPKPTPKPTPRPTAQPTAVPTQAPAPTAAPQTTEPRTPRPSRRPSPSERPPRSQSPSPDETRPPASRPGKATPEPSDGLPIPGGTDTSDQQLITIISGGLIAIGAVTLIGIFAILHDRRRKSTDAIPLLLPDPSAGETAPPPPAPTPRRAPTAWERDFALDHEPIGTVEYQPPPTPDEEDR
jgi:hypothetical protein